MENNSNKIKERVLLMMKYDVSKTLNENSNIVKKELKFRNSKFS